MCLGDTIEVQVERLEWETTNRWAVKREVLALSSSNNLDYVKGEEKCNIRKREKYIDYLRISRKFWDEFITENPLLKGLEKFVSNTE